MLRRCIQLFAIGVILFYYQTAFADKFSLPPSNEALVGDVQFVSTLEGDTPATIAQRFGVGLNAILTANPGLTETTQFTAGTSLIIPTAFLLPSLPRKGIIINLPEMRLYYYPTNSSQVMTFPIGIGRIGKTIPLRNTTILRKKVNPEWIPTPNIRKFNEEQGIKLPHVMPAGPDNPLGPYAIYLTIPTYLIHSTIFPESIGRRASFGCIRMNENDIKEFFPLVQAGTPVAIIDMPNKVGWENNRLYMEVHPPLEEHSSAPYASLDGMVQAVTNSLPSQGVTLINWQLISYLAEEPDGIPHEIGVKVIN